LPAALPVMALPEQFQLPGPALPELPRPPLLGLGSACSIRRLQHVLSLKQLPAAAAA
jgi:hypothetical protein